MRSPVRLSDMEDEFHRYLVDVRAYSQSTIADHMYFFGVFHRFLKARRIRAANRISLRVAYVFFEDRARTYSRVGMMSVHWVVRTILRFLHYSGVLPEDLSAQMITPRIWSLAQLPKVFSQDEMTRLLANLRSETPYDHREHLMMMLFLHYGLRRGELIKIDTDDINWRTKTVTIRERKNAIPLVLPLLPEVEEALRTYLDHARPRGISTKRLLVTVKKGASGAPLGMSGAYHVIRPFFLRAGVKGPAGRFRHTLATRLLDAGVGLEAIADVLGHRRSNSARTYAKVHLEALREVADNYSMLL
jgi:site-specific recombinase XerD